MHQAHSEFIRKYSKNCLLSYRHTWFKILSVNFFPSPLDVIFEEGLNHLQPDLIFIILVFKSLCVFIFQNSVK
ncbi:MAG TPA: hypothetical protein PK453_15550, partial [Leptospiraceae bacterium]|nr:hypothetical protein [Leptospiraceae bacterium]HNF27178.1 hypothetical protein [Leptospiraceae bacterium]HNM03064.1 hypothetical protein [Leptospiraceae bacterium]HNN05562.1 hypothetical protein [Leptospiraceae bacterium]HNO26269.1 hypothetical protein [Leptospiraceae bacterium]